MREMWVDPRFFDKKSFACFDRPLKLGAVDEPTMPVVVLTKEEWGEVQKDLRKLYGYKEEVNG